MIKYLKDWQEEDPFGFGAFMGVVFFVGVFLIAAGTNGCFG